MQFFDFQQRIHQKFFAAVPYSIGDAVYILLAIVLIILLIRIVNKNTRNSYFLKLLILLNILYFTYQIFWGMLYFQEPIIDKLPENEITLEETKALTIKYLELSRQARLSVEEDHKGVFKLRDITRVKTEILSRQERLPVFLEPTKPSHISSFKPSLFRGVMSYSGILGYYNPFTAEAQYNPELPSTYLPFTLAHESAHQMGYAREQEANFIAFLIGKDSTNPELRYSTYYFVLKSLLNSLAEKNPHFVRQTISNYSLGMKRDRAAEKKFVQDHKGIMEDFFGFTNDLFLKSNRQEGSITYSYFVDLMVRFERNPSANH
ncbi:DUF3810 domain-containing protein [Kaistella faecalis]|uniref:DUF3810 domain-containing protein n=1 Tax=Kaistella faecalis TaxID=2852098 RepID=UPI001E51E6EC|nr:DUF3810 domain-containing protein [Chryseobacterium faecale]UFK98983.1 DUF3810 domain-containing protein [Chryseobacterium faecale]